MTDQKPFIASERKEEQKTEFYSEIEIDRSINAQKEKIKTTTERK